MERSRKVFRKIASASHRVVAVANDYADREDSVGVPRCHFQLEEDMRRISVACECLAAILGKPPSEQGPAVDVRIQDWLNTDGPEECLRTLDRMESLLQQDTSLWMPRIIQRLGRSSTATQDKIKEAVDLFNSCKACFHFLSSAEIWNNERAVQKQQDVPQSRDHIVQAESDLLESGFPVPVQTEINTAVPLDPGVYQGDHAEHVTQGGSDVVVQGLPAPIQADMNTAVIETVNYQDRPVVTQRRHEMKTDERREGEEKKFQEILKWLDGLNCAEKQDVTLLLRQEDTCKWLLDTTEYKMWKDGESGSLWLRGKPGAGKSVLASFVVDSFKKAWREGEILLFFYCDFRNERSTSSAGVMRSILSQLLRQLCGRSVDLGNVLDDLMKAKEWGGGTLSNAKELAGFASRAARLSSQKPLVVVDALDECKDVRKLIQALMLIRGHVRLFLTSRPWHIIVKDLEDVPFVSMDEMADKLSADIALHVTRELDARHRLRDLDSGFKTEIRSVLCDKADGMFRWVQCSIDALDQCVTRKEVRKALDSLPKGLNETYERILLAIDTGTSAGKLTQQALVWLVAALRPLRLSEIMEALTINLQTRTLDSDIGPMHSGALLDACGSLVTYTERTGIIILSHSSVKEYLMGEFTRAKLQQYHISRESAHLLVARSCMCYISICLKRGQGTILAEVSSCAGASSKRTDRLHRMSQRLLDYALDDALDHFGYLGSKFESALPDIIVLAEDIRQHSKIWDNVHVLARWGVGTKPHWPAARHDLLLYILVAFTPNSFMREFFHDNALKPKEGTNPLVYAAHFNKDEHARTLRCQGAKLHHRGWEISGFRQSLPIEVAFRNRHYTMITHFVEGGSAVPPHIFTDSFFKRDGPGDTPSCTPMIPSSIARVLVQTDDFAEHMNNCLNEAALRAMKMSGQLLVFGDATEQDLIAIIRRFIQIVDEHFTPNSIREAFLRFAVSQGYCSAAQYLLTLGTPLPSDLLVSLRHYSGKWKTAPMIRFLVDNGADILVHTNSRDSVLHAILWAPPWHVANADEDDILGAVKLLVDYGCDPLEANFCGNTPIHIAVERGHISVAQYLLNLGAHLPPDLPASSWSTAPMIHFLVENGANVLAHTSVGDHMIHIVLRSIYNDNEALETVKLLVSYGCDPLEANFHGNTPIYIAVRQGHLSVARYLLTLGAHLPPDLLVTLQPASRSSWSTAPMIHFLVENGANVLAHTGVGDHMIHIVLRSIYDDNEALETVKLLVSYGCDPLEANFHGNTPIHIAVEQGHLSVARYLLTLGAHLHPDLLVTLKSANWSSWATAPMIHFLVENGVNIHARASDGDSVLNIMLESIFDDIRALQTIKLLVGYGCNPLEDSRGDTPLHIAVKLGHVSAARYLLTLGAHLPPDSLVTLMGRWSLWIPVRVIRFLIENGANVLAHTSDGDSMLHIALRSIYYDNEALESVQLLVGYGCNPLEANSHGDTPLRIAVEHGHVSAARYLLTLGAHLPPNPLVTLISPWWDRTIVPTGMIRFLIENGVDVLARTSDGDSTLHIVLWSLHNSNEALESVQLLVSNGCDPLEANSYGNTPLHIAVKQGHISVARYFLSLGAHLPPDLLVTFKLDFNRRRFRFRSGWSTIPMICFLVEKGVDVLARAGDGDSVLHIVLRSLDNDKEALETVKLLVGLGCNPLTANSRGNTPLHTAVERGHISTARYLLTLGAHLPPGLLVTLNRHWSYWSTAPMIRFLVERGVNLLAHTSDGNSMLHIALRCSNLDDDVLEAVKLLVGYGCDPLEANSRGNTPLRIAVEQGHISAARHLLTLGAHLPPDFLVTLNRRRPYWNKTPMIRFLVENGVNVLAHSSDGDSVLHTALQCSVYDRDTLEVVKALVSYGCDPLEANFRGNTPLHIAVERGHISAAEYLLALGAALPPDLLVTLNRDWSRWSTEPMIRFLVENGVNVHAHASDGDSVLHFALRCFNRDYDVLKAVKLLVGYGCDPLEANSRGETPLHIAAERSYGSVARYLITKGASVLTKVSNGDTVLHFATGGVYHYPHEVDEDDRALEAVKYFLRWGCEPPAPNDNGETPLHIAVDLGRIKTMKHLLSLNIPLPRDILFTAIESDNNSAYCRYIVATLITSGCDTRTPNSDGDTPLRVAIMKGKVDVVEYLLSVVSEHNPPLEDLLSTAELAPPSVQSEMRRMLSAPRARSESPDLPPAKRARLRES